MISWQAILIAITILIIIIGLVFLSIRFPKAVGIPCITIILILYVISIAYDVQHTFLNDNQQHMEE